MAKEQPGLPGILQAAKRKIIEAIEDKCLERDKLAGKRTAMSDKVAEQWAEIQALLVEHKLEVYTYEDASGVLQDVTRESVLKKRKSKLNPKKAKKDE
jgi:hypothetical protein